MNTKIVVVIIAFFSFLGVLNSCDSTGDKSKENGTVIFVSGDVRVDGTVAEVGMVVGTGATLKTGKDSTCEIVFNEKNILKIFENSETTLDFTPESKGITLKSGAVASVVKRLVRIADSDRYRYAVRTPTAVTGVRGTSFYVRVESRDSTYICCCNGVLRLEGSKGEDARQIEAAHHKAIRIKKIADQVVMTPEKMLYHTDSGMEGLANKINVKIDWKKIDREIESF